MVIEEVMILSSVVIVINCISFCIPAKALRISVVAFSVSAFDTACSLIPH